MNSAPFSHAITGAKRGYFDLTWILFLIQMAVTVVVGCYFWSQLKKERQAQPGLRREASREMEHLRKMRTVHLSEPLSEHVRPQSFEDIIGQQEGIKSLKAILCGANPQHVIIYGPPGIGKTCAALLVLEYAKQCGNIVVAENHSRIGGLYSAVCETLARENTARIDVVAVNDEYGEVGPQDYLQKRFGLTAEHIVETATALLK